ncbi:hypothetical protein EVAR_56816_1 [Eumeta japonica]|uniref:Uncharacterized protein n=1 Tax=Eumeta variegata TaxID=151549 RepID=A0A4C1Y369_EUMVA|nr:hypothetical protein EVAR_56816_1 [Eumeta japonica]
MPLASRVGSDGIDIGPKFTTVRPRNGRRSAAARSRNDAGAGMRSNRAAAAAGEYRSCRSTEMFYFRSKNENPIYKSALTTKPAPLNESASRVSSGPPPRPPPRRQKRIAPYSHRPRVGRSTVNPLGGDVEKPKKCLTTELKITLDVAVERLSCRTPRDGVICKGLPLGVLGTA